MATSSRRATTSRVTEGKHSVHIEVSNLDRPTFVFLPRGKETTLKLPRSFTSSLVYIQPDIDQQDMKKEFIPATLINAKASKDIETVVSVVNLLQNYKIAPTGRQRLADELSPAVCESVAWGSQGVSDVKAGASGDEAPWQQVVPRRQRGRRAHQVKKSPLDRAHQQFQSPLRLPPIERPRIETCEDVLMIKRASLRKSRSPRALATVTEGATMTSEAAAPAPEATRNMDKQPAANYIKSTNRKKQRSQQTKVASHLTEGYRLA